MMDRHAATSFKAQAKQFGQVLSSSPFLMAFSLSVVVQGVLLASLESYWQPYFRQLLVSDSQLWILALISASIFAVSVLESIIGKRFISHMRPSGLYFLAFALIFVIQLVLSQSNTLLQCLILYELIFLLLGVVSVVGMYLLNTEAPDAVRTSLSSVSSSCLQSGGVVGNVLAAAVFSLLSFWLLQRTPRT